MQSALSLLTGTAVCLLFAASAFAGDGGIPIWEPTVISEPGNYRLIRSVGDDTTEDTISITADYVDLDLNGFTVNAQFVAIRAASVKGLSIHDGFLRSEVDCLRLTSVSDFAIRRLVIDSGDDSSLVVSGSRGVVESNQIPWEWASISGDSISIVDNAFNAPLQLTCTNCRVTGNEILDIWVESASTGNLLLQNVAGVITVQGSDNLLKGNVVTETTFPSSAGGIEVTGSRNHLEGNTLVSNPAGYGLWFSASSADNIYRGNTVRGNNGTGCTGTASGGDFCDEGTGNTSHGDNYMPDLR